jgi:hypothetical protein
LRSRFNGVYEDAFDREIIEGELVFLTIEDWIDGSLLSNIGFFHT